MSGESDDKIEDEFKIVTSVREWQRLTKYPMSIDLFNIFCIFFGLKSVEE